MESRWNHDGITTGHGINLPPLASLQSTHSNKRLFGFLKQMSNQVGSSTPTDFISQIADNFSNIQKSTLFNLYHFSHISISIAIDLNTQ